MFVHYLCPERTHSRWCDTCLRTPFLSNKGPVYDSDSALAPLTKKLIIYNTEKLGGGSLQRIQHKEFEKFASFLKCHDSSFK